MFPGVVEGFFMRNLLLRFLITAVAIAVITSGILPGIRIIGNQISTLLIVAVILGIINALVKPIVKFLTCPFILLSLGLLLFVINGLMLWLAAFVSEQLALSGPVTGQLVIDHFGWAIVGALIMSAIGMVLEPILGVNERKRVKQVTEIRYVVERPRPTLDAEFDDFVNSRPFDDNDDKPKRR